MRCEADTGGTFTDIVTDDGRVVKVLSTPDDPSLAVVNGLAALADADTPSGDGAERPSLLAHGTTVATNALLERRGGRVALVTTVGFADVIEIARSLLSLPARVALRPGSEDFSLYETERASHGACRRDKRFEQ